MREASILNAQAAVPAASWVVFSSTRHSKMLALLPDTSI